MSYFIPITGYYPHTFSYHYSTYPPPIYHIEDPHFLLPLQYVPSPYIPHRGPTLSPTITVRTLPLYTTQRTHTFSYHYSTYPPPIYHIEDPHFLLPLQYVPSPYIPHRGPTLSPTITVRTLPLYTT